MTENIPKAENHDTIMSWLRMYMPTTHAIEWTLASARIEAAEMGLIEWQSPMFGSNNMYSITEYGKQYLKDYDDD